MKSNPDYLKGSSTCTGIRGRGERFFSHQRLGTFDMTYLMNEHFKRCRLVESYLEDFVSYGLPAVMTSKNSSITL